MNLLTKSLNACSRELDTFARQMGLSEYGSAAIPADKTFRDWCNDLSRAGLKVDGFPFTLENRPAMWFIYDLVPTTIDEAYGRTVVMMKCAQVGFTVMEMLAAIYMAIKFEPCRVGMYLPDMKLAAAKSTERFMPIVRTVPVAYDRLTVEDSSGTGRRRKGEGNVMIRAMGESRFHFLWTSGKATTESFPMDVISFDEVQEMRIADMEKTNERLSASRIKFTIMGSTANWPDRDIHWWYVRGTNHQFHTRCQSCAKSMILDECFPECVRYDPEAMTRDGREGDYRYACVHCQAWIDDTQHGEWIAKNPEARIVSVHFHQMLSPTISAREVIESYRNADDLKNFWNRKLGKPYTDPSQVPVNLVMLNQCMADGIAAGVVWEARAKGTFMGIDQMGCFNVAVIKRRLSDGRQAVIHLEYIYQDNPFARCDELMKLYGVQCCVVESLPNYNDAKAFAKRHSGKVFTVATYTDIPDEMMRWGDTENSKADRKISDEARDRYVVTLDQYKCMQVSMARFAKGACVFPDKRELGQDYKNKSGEFERKLVLDVAFDHFLHTGLIAEKDEEQKKYRRRVVKIGIDPHTSYANMLCDVAWARAYGTGTFLLPDAANSVQTKAAAHAAATMPGLPAPVMAILDTSPPGTCGRCAAFEAGNCTARFFTVGARDPGCDIYVSAEE